MTSLLIRIGLPAFLYLVLVGIGNAIDLALKSYLVQFFVFLRSVVAPLDFIWHFDTTFILLGITLNLFIAYFSFKAFLTLRNLFTGVD